MPSSKNRGLLITFEGGEGAGKTTQAGLLARRLTSVGRQAIRTFEPGGTLLGNALRDLLLNSGLPISPIAQLLLFEAARAQNVDDVIKPSLDAGISVLCDRFIDTTLAYQGHGLGLDLEMIVSLNRIAARGLVPDLTVLLDVDPTIGLARVSETAEGDRIGGHLQLGLDLGDPLSGKRHGGWEIDVHRRVRDAFLSLAKNEPKRWLVIDAALPEPVISERIWEGLLQKFPV